MQKSIFFIFLFSILNSSSLVFSQDAFLAPITKDNSTNLYSLSNYLKTPLQITNLHLDLGASISWVDCIRRYKSSSYQHLLYNTSLCESLETLVSGNCFKKPGPGCFNDSCEYFCENSVTRNVFIGNILLDSLALSTTDGRNLSRLKVVKDFIFACSNTKILRGLPTGVTGVAALGRFNYSLPFQLSRAGSSPAVFAVCLPSSAASGNGVAFFNSAGPYNFLPGIDVSKSLIYTPLLLNPVVGTVIFYTRPSDEYFIGVSSIKVNGKSVPLNQTLLKINEENGYGGTKISTSTPYTVLQTAMFKAVTERFVAEAKAMNLTVTTPVKPFEVCFPAKAIAFTRLGPAVPTIDLVLQKPDVFWRIFGSNSMVRVKAQNVDVWCLGFVDGGPEPRTSIVIGGHQIEDNLLQFDLAQKRFGFSSSLLFKSTNCANFDFTSRK
ncbi:putative aspartic proteinase GIP1 [Nicotiana tabacum]|uniref:Aspartic proteinase GIP1 n=1 Tax=Nicotiana tabacum TaxID=4097 RepID=A0A1S4A3K1_TOBAC